MIFETTKENADRCITTVREHSSNALLMDLFNLAFPGAPTMPVFSGRERTRRRQRSSALRDAMLSDIAYCGNNEKKYSADLPYQSLLYPEMFREGNSGAEDNEYIRSIFDSSSEAYARRIEKMVSRSIEMNRRNNIKSDPKQLRKDYESQGKTIGHQIIVDRMAGRRKTIP